jgi:hypothetical protein
MRISPSCSCGDAVGNVHLCATTICNNGIFALWHGTAHTIVFKNVHSVMSSFADWRNRLQIRAERLRYRRLSVSYARKESILTSTATCLSRETIATKAAMESAKHSAGCAGRWLACACMFMPRTLAHAAVTLSALCTY